MHFGIITPPVPGHLHPFGALGRELIRRGHRVVVLHMPDLQPAVQRECLEFISIGDPICPPGFLGSSLRTIGKLGGLHALRFTLSQIRRTTEMFLRYAPSAIRSAGIDALLVDQTEPAGATIADYLGIPFATICNALALNREPDIPPPFTSWSFRPGLTGRLRNQLAYAVQDWIMRPIRETIAQYRRSWGLPPLASAEDSYSKIIQISQQAPAFDFPRQKRPANFHYVGPLRSFEGSRIPFPWERLDGRPIIYASLGTLQTGKRKIFHCIAEACAGLDLQLVMAHCGALSEAEERSLPGGTLAASYVPQRELLARASLTLSHAGLNTVLDSLSFGVPLVAIPITFEQPGIASRLAWCRAGRILRLSALTPSRLRAAVLEVLQNKKYAENACRMKESIEQAGGVTRAARLLEEALC